MNKNLEQLVQIAQIDKESDAFEPQISKIRTPLDKLLSQKTLLEQAQANITEEKKEAAQAITRNESTIEENNQKIEQITTRIKEGCSNREAHTLGMEEDLAKEQIRHANQEIERLNKAIQAKAPKEQEIAKQVEELESQILEVQKQADAAIEDIKKQQHAIFVKKEQCIASMDQKIIAFYEKVRKWAKNTSVVPVEREACGGCFIKLNDRTLSEISKGTEIITCPHCGRILYFAKV